MCYIALMFTSKKHWSVRSMWQASCATLCLHSLSHSSLHMKSISFPTCDTTTATGHTGSSAILYVNLVVKKSCVTSWRPPNVWFSSRNKIQKKKMLQYHRSGKSNNAGETINGKAAFSSYVKMDSVWTVKDKVNPERRDKGKTYCRVSWTGCNSACRFGSGIE